MQFFFFVYNINLQVIVISRLEDLSLKQEEEKNEKVDRWEIWIIRIRELQVRCRDKAEELKSKSEPQNKKDVEEQIILVNVSMVIVIKMIDVDYDDSLIQVEAFSLLIFLDGAYHYCKAFLSNKEGVKKFMSWRQSK